MGLARTTLDPELTILGARDLVALVGRLARERSWGTLTAVFNAIAAGEGLGFVSAADLGTASRLVADALAAAAPPPASKGKATKSGRGAGGAPAPDDETRALRLAAADALLSRIRRPPLGEQERRTLERAAGLLADAGDHARAARAYEDLGDEVRAAESWGALGDLDRMEAALEREEQRAAARRHAADVMRRFEALLTAGERREALALASRVAGVEEAAGVRQIAARTDGRLVRGRAVSLRRIMGPSIRIAGLPATVGRDPGAEIPLRDPGVSRRHALIRAAGGGLVLEDAGSRAGVRVGGARLEGVLPLRDVGEIALGSATALRYRELGSALFIEGLGGLDRNLVALVGPEPLPLAAAFPEADGLSLSFEAGVARLVRRLDVAVRVDGQLVGPGCDLLHGDVIEIGVAAQPGATGGSELGLRLEVE